MVYKIHNRELAESLWRLNDDGSAWEFMYFLQDLRSLDIPYEAFNRAAGYSLNNVIQGFSVLSDSKSQAVLALVDLHNPLQEARVKKNWSSYEGQLLPWRRSIHRAKLREGKKFWLQYVKDKGSQNFGGN